MSDEKKEGEQVAEGPEGCYLTFESSSGGQLMLIYSKSEIPLNAIGFWCPGSDHQIQGFKFKSKGGKSELIKGIAGGDQNRRKYYSGWCQFIKLAKAMNGYVIKFPNPKQGVEVDVVLYKTASQQPYELDLDEGLVEVAEFDAIAGKLLLTVGYIHTYYVCHDAHMVHCSTVSDLVLSLTLCCSCCLLFMLPIILYYIIY
jgi:hypothetical protein